MASVRVERPSPAGFATSSAAGLLALLEEDDHALRVGAGGGGGGHGAQEHALRKLLLVVDQHWAETAEAVAEIEQLAEDENVDLPQRQLAAAVASKIYYHLEEYSDARRLALGAGDYFDVGKKDEYVETMIANCIDEYISQRHKAYYDGVEEEIDPRLVNIVEKMFERCFNDEAYEQAMGIALESLRLDMVESTIQRSTDKQSLLAYAQDISQTLVTVQDIRLRVLKILVEVHEKMEEPDYPRICQCLQFLGDAHKVSMILQNLAQKGERESALAYQIAFDIVETENQQFVLEVAQYLPQEPKKEDPDEINADDMVVEQKGSEIPSSLKSLRRILAEGFPTLVALNFLATESQTDILILRNIKNIDTRNSVLHNATIVAHGYMTAGTTSDTFLRENLSWLRRANNWAKFTAIASLGVVHRGHVKTSMELLAPFLPGTGISDKPYQEGGALYGLGLIHANKGGDLNGSVITYLSDALDRAAADNVVQHGSCLGIGLTAMGSADPILVDKMQTVIEAEDAVSGEGAAVGMGLLLLGYGSKLDLANTIMREALNKTADTKHEKIIRGLSMSIALILYGQEENAETMIIQMSGDRDPILRYGAMYTIGLAYAGTSNNNAIRRLLHVAVSDVSDDVRRAAVTNIGFVMFRNPDQVPRLVALLAESFNAHVRYGACLAIGIACAGSGMQEAMSILDPMLDDGVDFVRQGAMMGMAMVLMQQAEAKIPRVRGFRQKISKIISDKHHSLMTKMGAIMATGILDAGGRNVTISMQSQAGFTKSSAVVGLAIWAQYWYWYPFMHFLSLAFSPTMLIGLNKDFNIPKDFKVKCNARHSIFAYPKKLEEKKEEKKERVQTAPLSIATKIRARKARKEQGRNSSSVSDSQRGIEMLIDEETKKEEEERQEVKEKEKEKEEEKRKEKEPEPSSFWLSNPARVIPTQEPFVEFDVEQRYVPIKLGSKAVGIVVLEDTTPDVPAEVSEVVAPQVGDGEEEADPPKPFTFDPRSLRR